MKREALFTLKFRHWLKSYGRWPSSAFELKQTTGSSIPFDAVQEHQIEALLACKVHGGGFLYKAPDDSRGVKPFDMFYMRHSGAFVVIKYPKEFSIVDVDVFLLEKKRSKRKSLTMERAREISTVTIKLRGGQK